MPIKFYKTTGEPPKTFPGSEEVHFSQNGYIYVSDLNGEQRLMYRTAVEEVAQEGSKGLSVTEIGGDRRVIRFDFYSTEECDTRFITQSNPMIGEYKIYHEGFQPSGLMSELDKRKLLGIDPGAQVNQKAYSTMKVDNIMLDARTTTDTFTINAGSNINIVVDQANREMTINAVMSSALVGPLSNVEDVDVQSLEDGDVMMYDAKTQSWKNSFLITKELYLKSPNGDLWAVGVEDNGTLYVESANLVEE